MKRMYQIYDLGAGLVSGPIFLEHNDKPACRNFRGIFAIPDSTPNKFPEQFELRCLGTQDEETGVVAVHNPHIVVDTGMMWQAEQVKSQQIQAARQAFTGETAQ